VLVTLRGSKSYVVRDVTDINHPKTLSNLGAIQGLQFVSATELSYLSGSLLRVPLAGSPKAVVTDSAGIVSFAWSPDGSSVAYVTQSNTVHLLKAGRDQVLGSIPGGGPGGCETIAGCAIANSLNNRLLFSPDGTKISLVTLGFGGSVFRIWSSDGKLLASSDTPGTTMSAWSGSSLYFRDVNGVEVWRDGGSQPFLYHQAWIGPKGSPNGGQIVYVVRDSNGWGHTIVVDTNLQQRELKKGRVNPVFLSSRYIWYQGERACVAADACGAKPPWHPLSGKNYIYDLLTGTETESIITSVSDVWPHPA
jgi:Tol biopolymer transport system component